MESDIKSIKRLLIFISVIIGIVFARLCLAQYNVFMWELKLDHPNGYEANWTLINEYIFCGICFVIFVLGVKVIVKKFDIGSVFFKKEK